MCALGVQCVFPLAYSRENFREMCEIPMKEFVLYSSSHMPMVAAGVVGCLLVVVILALSVFIIARRRHIRRKRTLRRLLQEREVKGTA